MALFETIGISSIAGSIGQLIAGARGGFASPIQEAIATVRAQRARPTPPTPEPAIPDPGTPAPELDVGVGGIGLEAARAAVAEWLAKQLGRDALSVATDRDLADLQGRIVDCLLRDELPVTDSNIEKCARDSRVSFALPGLLRGPIIFPPSPRPGTPGTTAPGRRQPGVIRPRDRVSPTGPEIGPPGRVPSRLPFPDADPMPQIDFPPLGEPLPRLPDLVEIELLPVRLPVIRRRKAPVRVKQPPPPAPSPAPATIPIPAPAPAPIPPGPTTLPGVLIGTAVGAGIGLLARARVPGVRTPSGSIAEPPPPGLGPPTLAPDLVGVTQTQAQRLRPRTKRDNCEKRARKNRKICWTGIYKEGRRRTKFVKWYARDCITGEFLEKTERK